jgi:hypothetical protein
MKLVMTKRNKYLLTGGLLLLISFAAAFVLDDISGAIHRRPGAVRASHIGTMGQREELPPTRMS